MLAPDRDLSTGKKKTDISFVQINDLYIHFELEC